jgi:response regulator RpfG family c-di-GMP phosphodiesterase
VQNLKQLRQSQLLYKNWADVLRDEVEKATKEISQREHETLRVLGNAAEYKDPETGEHILRVAHYSRIIAEAMTDDKDMQTRLFHASPLHDIGKIGIPDTILLKPARLTADEFEVMKTHTSKGAEIISNTQSPYLKTGMEIALSHHEKWNGKGYPRGLKGEEIPLNGRITAVVDVLDALTSKRPYKEPWSFEDSIALIRDEREQHFAPDAVDALLSQLDKIREIYHTYSDLEAEPESETASAGESGETQSSTSQATSS